jgi:UDP-N-acetylmuramate: L-alanyl-gamma-D-glutamyl-meso-diaminopimelate ligase
MFPQIKSIHFTGIGGTAMAAVAAAMRDKGFAVTGSDHNVYPPMSTFLAARNIEVMPGYAESNLAGKPDLVVIGNAISRGNAEAEYVLDQKLRYCSLPELLREFFIRGKRSVVVAGTHGKTTTTSLLAWVFEHNGLNPSFLIGGVPNNFGEAPVSPTAPGSLSRETNMTRLFLTNEASSSITCPKWPLSTIWNSITRIFLTIWPRCRPLSNG